MALSNDNKKKLRNAMADKDAADAVAAAIDSNGSGPSAYVAPLGATTNLTAIAASYADLAAARTSVNTLRTDAEARLDAIEGKVDAIIAALIAAGMMASS